MSAAACARIARNDDCAGHNDSPRRYSRYCNSPGSFTTSPVYRFRQRYVPHSVSTNQSFTFTHLSVTRARPQLPDTQQRGALLYSRGLLPGSHPPSAMPENQALAASCCTVERLHDCMSQTVLHTHTPYFYGDPRRALTLNTHACGCRPSFRCFNHAPSAVHPLLLSRRDLSAYRAAGVSFR